MTSTQNNNKNEDDFDHDVISNIPDLQIAQQYFLFKKIEQGAKAEKFTALLNRIKENEMGPFYEYICQDSDLKIDRALLKNLLEKNSKIIAEIDAEIKDAEENLSESDVRQAWLKKSEYLCQIGDKNAAVSAFQSTFDKTVGLGYRIDLVFNLIRLGLFFLDHKLINANITRAKELMKQGGDWDRKNRLRCYEGLYKMVIRDFKSAATLFLEVVPTFGSTELITYEDLIFYTVIACMYSLDRPDLYSKVIRCNEIQEQLNGGGTNGALIPVKKFLDSFYGCLYDQFYLLLAQLEVDRLKFDRYLEPHYYFYSRNMRLKAYAQFLAPYKTVRLDMMAKDFGVSKEFIDKELHAQVSAGLLKCRIDAVNEIIEITHSDKRNDLYKSVIHDGDTLLNRVQKLARVIHS